MLLDRKKPRIAIIGSRGVPANYGGFETFAEEISVHLVKKYGYEVTVVSDIEQKKHNAAMKDYNGVNLRYSSYSKAGNAIRFYYDSIKKVITDHDIIYSCGPAGGLFGVMVRKHGKIMMTNPDGLNSKRSKWSLPIQLAFRVFEFFASRFSDWVVCDSKAIEEYICNQYGCKNTFVAEYGAYINSFIHEKKMSQKILQKYGVESKSYHLVVSRLEPENNVEMIISGYEKSSKKWPLMVVGNVQETAFVQKLKNIAGKNVYFVGGVYDKDELSVIRAHAISYLHGHSVGGTNPSLLEAMGSRNLCICHDNPFNREVVSDNGLFFKDSDGVERCIEKVETNSEAFDLMRNAVLDRIVNYYNWEKIADKYHTIFLKAYFQSKV